MSFTIKTETSKTRHMKTGKQESKEEKEVPKKVTSVQSGKSKKDKPLDKFDFDPETFLKGTNFQDMNSDFLKLKSKIKVYRIEDDLVVVPPENISSPFSISDFCYGKFKGSDEFIVVASIMCPAGKPNILPYFPMPETVNMNHTSWRKYVYDVEKIGLLNRMGGEMEYKDIDVKQVFYEIGTSFDATNVYGLALSSMDLNPRYLPMMQNIVDNYTENDDNSVSSFAKMLTWFIDSISGNQVIQMDPLSWSVERAVTMANILAGDNFASKGYAKSLNSLINHLSMHIDPSDKTFEKYKRYKTMGKSVFENNFFVESQATKSKNALFGNSRIYKNKVFEGRGLDDREKNLVTNNVIKASKSLFTDFLANYFSGSISSTKYIEIMYRRNEGNLGAREVEEKIKNLKDNTLRTKSMIIPTMLQSVNKKYNFVYVDENGDLQLEKGIMAEQLLADSRGSMSELLIGSKTFKLKKFNQEPETFMPEFMKSKPCCF